MSANGFDVTLALWIWQAAAEAFLIDGARHTVFRCR
jgi:hypothetical protein